MMKTIMGYAAGTIPTAFGIHKRELLPFPPIIATENGSLTLLDFGH